MKTYKIAGTVLAALVLITLLGLMAGGIWEEATEGTVKVQTIYSKITKVIHGGDSIWTYGTFGDKYYELNLRSETFPVTVTASTKDNAALTVNVQTTGHVIYDDDNSAIEHLRRFGLVPAERNARIKAILEGQVNTETKNVIAEYDAYTLLANQEEIQKKLTARLTPIYKSQLNMTLDSIQIIGKPDFVDDRIEQAASQVVANQKLKEASQAALEAAKVDAEKKQVEAQTYANPNLLQIRKLELQKEIATEWSKHQGTLVFGSNAGFQITEGK